MFHSVNTAQFFWWYWVIIACINVYIIRFPTYFIHFTTLVIYIFGCLYMHVQCPCAVIYAVLDVWWLCTYPCFILFTYIMFTSLSRSLCLFLLLTAVLCCGFSYMFYGGSLLFGCMFVVVHSSSFWWITLSVVYGLKLQY